MYTIRTQFFSVFKNNARVSLCASALQGIRRSLKRMQAMPNYAPLAFVKVDQRMSDILKTLASASRIRNGCAINKLKNAVNYVALSQ